MNRDIWDYAFRFESYDYASLGRSRSVPGVDAVALSS